MQNNQSNIQKIIERSTNRHQEQRKEFYLFGKWFYTKDAFVVPINVPLVIDELEAKIPSHLFEEVDEFFVGNFEFLTDKGLEALFKDGAIYITNSILSETDLIENIIHELAHSLEQPHGQTIYADGLLRKEFLGKRGNLKTKLEQEHYDLGTLDFYNSEYDSRFDNFLYQVIGYGNLTPLVIGIYPSPYAATSLREYWSVGFEDYFVGDREYLKRVSPVLFSKIEEVISYEY